VEEGKKGRREGGRRKEEWSEGGKEAKDRSKDKYIQLPISLASSHPLPSNMNDVARKPLPYARTFILGFPTSETEK
jgi:hypothetical protein